MASSLIRATGGRNGAGEIIVVSTVEFDPPGDEGMPYQYHAETAVFCDERLAAIVRRYSFPEQADRQHPAIVARALR